MNDKNNVTTDGQVTHNLEKLVSFESSLAAMTVYVRQANDKWWRDPVTREPVRRNVGEMLMLVVSEIAEGMEGHRKSKMDDKLTDRPMLEVELADALIRILDISGGLGLDLAGAFREKMIYNAVRADHTFAARSAPGGKTY